MSVIGANVGENTGGKVWDILLSKVGDSSDRLKILIKDYELIEFNLSLLILYEDRVLGKMEIPSLIEGQKEIFEVKKLYESSLSGDLIVYTLWGIT
jgi:hypothetical protein